MEPVQQDRVTVIWFGPAHWGTAEQHFTLVSVTVAESEAGPGTKPIPARGYHWLLPLPIRCIPVSHSITGALSDANTLAQVVKCSVPRLAKG